MVHSQMFDPQETTKHFGSASKFNQKFILRYRNTGQKFCILSRNILQKSLSIFQNYRTANQLKFRDIKKRSPIHQFKVLQLGQRVFQTPYLMMYYFLFVTLKNHFNPCFFLFVNWRIRGFVFFDGTNRLVIHQLKWLKEVQTI